MHHVTCTACNNDVLPRPPQTAYWGLIGTFWAFSLLFGIGAALTGWSFILLLAWLLLACTVNVLAQGATSWTCPNCSAVVTPPTEAEQTAMYGRAIKLA